MHVKTIFNPVCQLIDLCLFGQPLHQKVPPFFGKDKVFNLSWKEVSKLAPAPAATAGSAR